MAGYIRERKGRHRYFELVVYNGRDPMTGRSRYISRGFNGASYRTDAAARKDAELELAKLVLEVADERHKSTDGTLARLLAEWMAKKVERRREETTVKGYRSIVKAVTASDLGAVALSDLTWKKVDDYLHSLHRAQQTVHNYHSVLHAALDYAVASDYIVVNPLDKQQAPSVSQEPLTTVPTAAQIERLVELASSSRNPALGPLIRLAAASGARRGEVCGLRWSSFDPDAGTLLIDQAVAHGLTKVIKKGPKTHAARRVNIGPSTVEVLRRHREKMEAEYGKPLPPSAYMFSNEVDGSEPMKPNSVTQAFDRLCTRAGFDGIRFHDIRHHFATSLLSRGVDVGTVADLLGHKNAAVTLNVYRHFIPAAGARAAALLDEILAGG